MTSYVIIAMFVPWGMGMLGFLGYGAHLLVKGIKISRSEPMSVAEARGTEGIVEVEGVAKQLEQKTEGKYSGEECLAYSWKKRKKGTDNDWNTVNQGVEGYPFLVKDGTGEIAVDPAGSSISSDTYREKPDSETKHIEKRIAPGDKIHVYGEGQSVDKRIEGMGTEKTYIGTERKEKSLLGAILERPHLFLVLAAKKAQTGEPVGRHRITKGDESDTVRGLALKGVGVIAFTLFFVLVGAYALFSVLTPAA